MKRFVPALLFGIVLIMTAAALAVLPSAAARAQADTPPAPDDIIAGALLYDRWYAALGSDAPSGNMPIWARQSTNSRSGAETWRCVECHGWDYKGAQGAYGSGSHYTGFPGVRDLAAERSIEELVGHLKGSRDPAHNFSAYMDDAALTRLAQFLRFGLINDDDYIDDVSLKAIGGDVARGKSLYDQTCAECHGADGKKIVFRTEGVSEYLGAVANRDPWRFLHRTRFGVAGVDMPVGAKLGWKVEEGRDVLAYVQSLETGFEVTPAAGVGQGHQPGQAVGGPPAGLAGGILTGLAALIGTLGSVLILGVILLAIGAGVVIILRKRN